MPFLDEFFRAIVWKVGAVVQPKRSHLKFGSGLTYTDDPTGDQGILTASGGGGGSSPNVASVTALKALVTIGSTPDVIDGQTRYVTGDPTPWVYDADSGAGFVGDNVTDAKPDDVSTPSNGRWYRSTSAPVLDTIAALRLATSGKHPCIHVQAFSTKGDGGGGIFDYDSTDTTSTDNVGTIIVAGTRRYKRRYAGSLELPWFGGLGQANYLHSDGKWYTDSSHTTQAPDDAAKLALAIAAGTSIHVPAANWHLRTRVGPHGEFVPTLRDNLEIYGDGRTTVWRVAGGINTNASGGYGAFLGTFDFAVGWNGVKIRNMLFDGNSDNNQFDTAGRVGCAHPENAVISIQKFNGLSIENIDVINHNGVYGYVVGSYGFPANATNFSIVGGKFEHVLDDPNFGDTSLVAIGATNGVVHGTQIVNGTSTYFPLGNNASAFEVHGSNIAFSGCVVDRCGTAVNIAADSADSDTVTVSGCTFKQVVSGISIFDGFGKRFSRLHIGTNTITIRQGDPASGEGGIQSAQNSVLSWPDGFGVHGAHIHNNPITFDGSVFAVTVAASTDLFTFAHHGMKMDQPIVFSKVTGATGITAGTKYYVLAAGLSANAFKVGATPGGATINITVDGSATVTCQPNTSSSWGISVQWCTGDAKYGGGTYIHDNPCTGFGVGGIAFNSANQPNRGLVKTFTASGVTLTSAAHTFVNNNTVTVASSGALPAGLSAGVTYYMVGVTANTFGLSLIPGGAAIVTTTAGTGTHTATQTTSNVHDDVHLKRNPVINCGTFGVAAFGYAAEVADVYHRLVIEDNPVVDNRGGSATLQYGTYIAARCDGTTRRRRNITIGFTAQPDFIDTINFPTTTVLDEDLIARSLAVQWPAIGANVVNGIANANPTAATALSDQWPLAPYVQGSYWDGAASKLVKWQDEYIPVATPVLSRTFQIGAGSPVTFGLYVGYSTTRIGVTHGTTAFFDQSGGGAGAIEMRFGNTSGSWEVTDDSGNTYFKASAAGGVEFPHVNSTTSAPSAGGADALPATPAGYATLKINGTTRQVAYY